MGRGARLDVAVAFLAVAGAFTLPMMGPIANPACLSPHSTIETSTYTVKGESMLPTLLPDDDIVACRAGAFDVERGDLVIFDKARNGRPVKRLKRIIGMPGDRIRMKDGAIVINGSIVPRRRIDNVTIAEDQVVSHYAETLPNGIAYHVLDMTRDGKRDNTPSVTIPAGFYYVMGDHRDVSLDSRAPRFGLVPVAALIAKVTHRVAGDPHKPIPAAAGSS